MSKVLKFHRQGGFTVLGSHLGYLMDILGITQCHYDGILAINLHSFSVKVFLHPSTNFTSLNILDMYYLGGGEVLPYVSHAALVLKRVYLEWGMDFKGTTGVYEHIYCYSSKLVRKKERVIYEFRATLRDLFQFSMTLGKAVI